MSRNRFVDIVNPDSLDPEFGGLTLVDMSWSRAETYDDTWSTFACPQKYKFKYMEKAETGWSIHLATGSIAHDTMEWVIKNEIRDETEVIGKFLEAISKHDPDNKMTDQEISVAREITIGTFRSMYAVVSDIKNVIDVEFGFRYVIGRGMFLGFIDLIFWDEDEQGRFIHILDYKSSAMDKKTGKPKSKAKNSGQLMLYTSAAKAKFPGERIKGSMYWMKAPEELKLDTCEFSDEQLAEFLVKMSKTVDDIIGDEMYKPTKKGFVCQYCDFANTEQCKWGASAAKRMYGYQKKKKAAK